MKYACCSNSLLGNLPMPNQSIDDPLAGQPYHCRSHSQSSGTFWCMSMARDMPWFQVSTRRPCSRLTALSVSIPLRMRGRADMDKGHSLVLCGLRSRTLERARMRVSKIVGNLDVSCVP